MNEGILKTVRVTEEKLTLTVSTNRASAVSSELRKDGYRVWLTAPVEGSNGEQCTIFASRNTVKETP